MSDRRSRSESAGRRSRSESMSTAPASTKLAMFQQMGEAKAVPAIVKPTTRIKGTVSAIGVVRCMNTRVDAKRGVGRKFDKNADGLPEKRSLTDLP